MTNRTQIEGDMNINAGRGAEVDSMGASVALLALESESLMDFEWDFQSDFGSDFEWLAEWLAQALDQLLARRYNPTD
eukprot:CAMPEP_0197055810 /NCGR_PEP_ID=MMETSP1384-20130603/74013_1 /TAXON_ID=29189 /ORGANISM="Ammonia sp." /LENGTH=76 /DNA_ID=CAMNT_0042489529 /DNA_START=10 /DNA_END=241 /DNA_ORIENTATION=-